MVAFNIRWSGGVGGLLVMPTTSQMYYNLFMYIDGHKLRGSAYKIIELEDRIKLVSLNACPRVLLNLYCFDFVMSFRRFSMKWKFIAEMVNEIVIWIAN